MKIIGSGLKKGKAYSSNFAKKGPYGIFLSKVSHPEGPEIESFLENHFEELLKHCLKWREFSIFRGWSFFKDQPVQAHGESRFKEFVKDPDHKARSKALISDAVLNYYLFSKLKNSEKDQLTDIFQARHIIKVSEKFSKDYIKSAIDGDEWVRKSDFILWMNNYLENCVSKEFLELSSFEIALKLGQLWNGLPYNEQKAWRLLAAEDEIAKDPKLIKKYQKKRTDYS